MEYLYVLFVARSRNAPGLGCRVRTAQREITTQRIPVSNIRGYDRPSVDFFLFAAKSMYFPIFWSLYL